MRLLNLSTVLLSATVLTSCGGQDVSESVPIDEPTVEIVATDADIITTVADELLAAFVKNSPITFALSGSFDLPHYDHGALNNNSPEALQLLQAKEDELRARISAVDLDQVSDLATKALYHNVKETLEANMGTRVCRQELWSLNHMEGWHTFLPMVATTQPVGTEAEREAAYRRWSALPAFIKQDKENLSQGLELGYSAPKRVTARVIGQLDAILALPVEEFPYASFIKNVEDDPEFVETMTALFENEIIPSLVEYREFLDTDYLPAARESLAISTLPNGSECYEAMLRSYHSAEIGSELTYKRGRETVERYKQEVIAIGQERFGVSDFSEIARRTAEQPENRFSSEEELITYTREVVAAARERVEPYFSHLPNQEIIVEPYPDFLKGSGASSRYESKPLGEPAIYRINTDQWAVDTRGEADIVAVHEAWPGHHLQIATAYELGTLHPLMRFTASTAYLEGWARYAEAFAEEIGIYEDGYAPITRRVWPARGMVVDPGLHIYGWTNEEARDFIIESGRFNEPTADILLDRIAVIPGQLTAYDTGGLEFFALRAEAEERLGDAFDLHDFHDRLLENGAVPLAALREHVISWIEAEEAKMN